DLFQADMAVSLRAKVENKDGEISLIADRVSTPSNNLLAATEIDAAHKIFIPRATPREKLESIGRLLRAHPGPDKVVVAISGPAGIQNKLLPYTVEWSSALEQEIKGLLAAPSGPLSHAPVA
ncbi:hypothetical protein IJJ12_02160, partial [bacterium]|nr:hypothetical protein [bacterium]